MTPNGPGSGPDVAGVLRSALEREASAVEVTPDALGDIRRRIANRRAKWLPRPLRTPGGVMFTTIGSAAAAAVVLVAVGIGSCVPRPANHRPSAGGSTFTTPSSTGSAAPSTGSSGTQSPGPVVHTLIPVYYIGDGPALYREFRDVQIPRNYQPAQLKSALSALLHTAPLDPDYSSLWGMTRAAFDNIQVDSAGVVTVDFTGSLDVIYKGPGRLSTAVKWAGVQQLVWTLTAVDGITGVRLDFHRQPLTILWGLTMGGVLHRGPAADTLAPIWIIDPQQNAVTGRSVTVNLAGIVFEARVTVDIYDAHGRSVFHTGVNLSTGAPSQGTATLHVTLVPGTYRIVAAPATVKAGATPPHDDHTFTVH